MLPWYPSASSCTLPIWRRWPLPTLSIAKEYVTTGTIESKEPNRSTQHTRRQSRKAFHAHIAAESKNGNQGPLIIYIIIALLMFIVGIAIEVNKT